MKGGQLLVINFASLPEPELMRRARDVAKALEIEAFVCCILDDAELPPTLPGRRERVREVRSRLISRCKNSLGKVLDSARAAGVDMRGYVKTADSPRRAAMRLVRDRSPSLVMIHRRPHTRFEDATLSGDDYAIIRASPVPVWVVNCSLNGRDSIVGAVDRAEGDDAAATLNERVLGNVSKLAEKLGKESHVLHAFGEAGLSRRLEAPAEDVGDDMGESRYDRRIREILRFGKAHGLPAECLHIHEGKLVNALEEVSEPVKAGVIVLGTRGRGRLQRLLSDSAAERVVQRVASDVLILKSSRGSSSTGSPPRTLL
jgi:universal stress protein E